MQEEDFKELYSRHAGMVYRICMLYLQNPADAEDAVQNIFIKAWERQEGFKDTEHRKAWFITVARNYCRDVLKSCWCRKRADIKEAKEFDKAVEDGLNRTATGSSKRTGKDEAVLEAIMELSAKYREVLYLYYFEEYSIKEISEILHRKESTIQTQLMSARKKLEKILIANGLHL